MSPDGPLKHHPFASLRNRAPATAPAVPTPVSPPEKPRLRARIVVREEHDPEENALVVRVIGLPRERLEAIGSLLRTVLGVAVSIEGRDLLVMSRDRERVAAQLRKQGASEVVVVKPPAGSNLEQAGRPGGTNRAEIGRGLHVAVVTKADQPTGSLTEGIVRDILTKSPVHPRGIKVRLEDGQVGRVRRILVAANT